MIIRVFQVLSVIFAAAAAYFWWADNFDFAFAGVVVAACSFFLSIRFQAATRKKEIDDQRARNSDTSSPGE